jgi:hypothetical protein
MRGHFQTMDCVIIVLLGRFLKKEALSVQRVQAELIVPNPSVLLVPLLPLKQVEAVSLKVAIC